MIVKVSSSIKNWENKILTKYGAKKYKVWDIFEPVTFFGLYHPLDYIKFIIHIGKKQIFWAGSDILNLQKSRWQYIIKWLKPRGFCENEVEQRALNEMGVKSKILPQFFGDVNEFPISFTPSKTPHIYIAIYEGREAEYGLHIIKNVSQYLPEFTFHIYGIGGESTDGLRYHQNVSEEKFNRDIRKYQAALRLNEFDGFSDTIAKSVLMGQWPITKIKYPNMSNYRTQKHLIALLLGLKSKTKPNFEGRNYWLNILRRDLPTV